MSDIESYLDMQRACYADLAARSNFADERFTETTHEERVVGWYVRHEAYDYERWLFDGVEIGAGAIAIDYGCGPGRMIRRLAPRFARIDGADISAEMIAIAASRGGLLASPPRLFITPGDGLPASLETTYDVAYSVICLQHIAVHSLRQTILASIFGALKPGGLFTFQMGYGPGHPALVDYYEDRTDATGTNGAADVTVLHPDDLAADLTAVGFVSQFALTPAGPGDTHAAWVFVRAWKPGDGAAVRSVRLAPGFQPLVRDPEGAAHAREVRDEHSIAARHHDLLLQLAASEARTAEAGEELRWQQDAAAALRADRDAWQNRAEAESRERVAQQTRADVTERQLHRLRVADRRRVRALIENVVSDVNGRGLRLGILGAGAHTQWLLDETALLTAQRVFLFDKDARLTGKVVGGMTVRPAADIAAMQLDAVVVSSLAFQDEMAGYVEMIAPGMRIVRCYP